MKKKYSLISKIIGLLLGFVVVAFGISTIVLITKANRNIEAGVNKSFQHKQRHIINKLKEGVSPDFFTTSKVKKLSGFDIEIDSFDIDSLILETEEGVYNLYRIRKKVFTIDKEYYSIELKKNIEDFTNLKTDIISTLITVFVILFLVIVIFSVLFSKYLFHPFNQILTQMKSYRVGNNFIFSPVKTSTREFYTMQQLYRKMLQQAEEDYFNLKEYTENMAHEFQTPLSIIRNKTENLIADEALMSSHTESVKSIYDETNHLSKLGSTLKLLTKIENNEFCNKKKIKSKEIIESHIERLRELAGLKLITINTDLDENHIFIMDLYLIEITLKNLIKNAILYSAKKSIIQIKTTSNYFSITNFSKVKEPLSDKMFKRFYKGDSNTSLGLGLAIVKKICNLNEMTIEYQFISPVHNFIIRNID